MARSLPSLSAVLRALPAGALVGSFAPFGAGALALGPDRGLSPRAFLAGPSEVVAGFSPVRVCAAPASSAWSLLVVLVGRGACVPVLLP